MFENIHTFKAMKPPNPEALALALTGGEFHPRPLRSLILLAVLGGCREWRRDSWALVAEQNLEMNIPWPRGGSALSALWLSWLDKRRVNCFESLIQALELDPRGS